MDIILGTLELLALKILAGSSLTIIALELANRITLSIKSLKSKLKND